MGLHERQGGLLTSMLCTLTRKNHDAIELF